MNKLEMEFMLEMDDVLECVNAEGEIIRVEIDRDTNEVKFVFSLQVCEDKECWHGY